MIDKYFVICKALWDIFALDFPEGTHVSIFAIKEGRDIYLNVRGMDANNNDLITGSKFIEEES